MYIHSTNITDTFCVEDTAETRWSISHGSHILGGDGGKQWASQLISGHSHQSMTTNLLRGILHQLPSFLGFIFLFILRMMISHDLWFCLLDLMYEIFLSVGNLRKENFFSQQTEARKDCWIHPYFYRWRKWSLVKLDDQHSQELSPNSKTYCLQFKILSLLSPLHPLQCCKIYISFEKGSLLWYSI